MNPPDAFAEQFLAEARQVVDRLDRSSIENAASLLAQTRSSGGRLFILGVGGSAANASHAVNDFRKLAGIEAYAPTDNVSEITARTNDEGWQTVFESWLRTSRLRSNDLVVVFSVGGGDAEKNISPNLISALNYAKAVNAKILGIVGRDGGHTAKVADVCIIIPTVNPGHITPHTEAFQSVVWHLLVSHPLVKHHATKWESAGTTPPNREPRPAIFLDRDGVLNRAVVRDGKPFPPPGLHDLEILPDAALALEELKSHGYPLYVITNQPDVARGNLTRAEVDAMNQRLASLLPVDDIFVCYHDDADHCACRKPKPGLIYEAQRKYNIDLTRSFLVGDRWRDIEAGHAAGCKTILIDYGYRERKPALPAEATVRSLREAAGWIIRSSLKESKNEVRL
jgi:D-sedoheptulose 7-phosphate isomerase